MAAKDHKRNRPRADRSAGKVLGENPGPLWLGAIILLALTVRVIVLWQLSENNPAFTEPNVDSRWHYIWAQTLAAGDWIGNGVFYRAPLYPYLLGVWFKLFGDGVWPIRLVQALAGAMTAGLVCLLASQAFTRRVGITAGFVWALYGPMIYYETEFLIPVLIIPLNLIAIWMAIRAAGSPDRLGRWLTIGVILGFSAIARPNILLTIPAFWMWSWMQSPGGRSSGRRRWMGTVALTLGLLIPILPVTIRNYVVGDDAVLIAYQGGVNLYLGNNPDADGLTMMMPDVKLDESAGWNEFVGTTDSIAMAQAGHTLSPSEISAHWMGKAIEYMRANPGETFGRWLKKTHYLLNGFEAGDQADIYSHTEYSSLLGTLIHKLPGFFYLPFGLIGAFAILATPLAWSDRIRTRPLLVFAILYGATVVPFLVTARHRLPLAVVMVMFAAAGFWMIVALWRNKRHLAAGIGVVAALLLIVALNRPTVERILWNPAFTLYQRALVHDRLGERYEAIELYEEALRIEPNHLGARRQLASDLIQVAEYDSAISVSFGYMRIKDDDAEVMSNMGLAYLGMGDTTKAKGAFRIAIRTNPSYGPPAYHLGMIELARDKTGEALGLFEMAVASDSAYPSPYNQMAMIYAEANNTGRAIDLLKTALRHVPNNGGLWNNLGAMLLEANRPDEAVEPITRSILLKPESPELRFNLAVAYVRTEQFRAAIEELELLLQALPDHAPGLSLLDRLNKARELEPIP